MISWWLVLYWKDYNSPSLVIMYGVLKMFGTYPYVKRSCVLLDCNGRNKDAHILWSQVTECSSSNIHCQWEGLQGILQEEDVEGEDCIRDARNFGTHGVFLVKHCQSLLHIICLSFKSNTLLKRYITFICQATF